LFLRIESISACRFAVIRLLRVFEDLYEIMVTRAHDKLRTMHETQSVGEGRSFAPKATQLSCCEIAGVMTCALSACEIRQVLDWSSGYIFRK